MLQTKISLGTKNVDMVLLRTYSTDDTHDPSAGVIVDFTFQEKVRHDAAMTAPGLWRGTTRGAAREKSSRVEDVFLIPTVSERTSVRKRRN